MLKLKTAMWEYYTIDSIANNTILVNSETGKASWIKDFRIISSKYNLLVLVNFYNHCILVNFNKSIMHVKYTNSMLKLKLLWSPYVQYWANDVGIEYASNLYEPECVRHQYTIPVHYYYHFKNNCTIVNMVNGKVLNETKIDDICSAYHWKGCFFEPWVRREGPIFLK